MLGENASLSSGRQGQRPQTARALARPAKVLMLDECTSVLDPANQAAVLETVRAAVERPSICYGHQEVMSASAKTRQDMPLTKTT